MMLLCTHLTGQAPFRRMLFHGMVRDERGKKMSKSFGNTIDPLPLIAEHGPDALRFSMARKARPGADVPFGLDDLTRARGYLTKLRSIAGLAARLGCTWEPARPTPPHLLDRWLLTRLDDALTEADAGYDGGDLARAADALTRLAEDDLSGLYLEARKDDLYDGDGGAIATLSHALTCAAPGPAPDAAVPHRGARRGGRLDRDHGPGAVPDAARSRTTRPSRPARSSGSCATRPAPTGAGRDSPPRRGCRRGVTASPCGPSCAARPASPTRTRAGAPASAGGAGP